MCYSCLYEIFLLSKFPPLSTRQIFKRVFFCYHFNTTLASKEKHSNNRRKPLAAGFHIRSHTLSAQKSDSGLDVSYFRIIQVMAFVQHLFKVLQAYYDALEGRNQQYCNKMEMREKAYISFIELSYYRILQACQELMTHLIRCLDILAYWKTVSAKRIKSRVWQLTDLMAIS